MSTVKKFTEIIVKTVISSLQIWNIKKRMDSCILDKEPKTFFKIKIKVKVLDIMLMVKEIMSENGKMVNLVAKAQRSVLTGAKNMKDNS